MAFYIGDFLEFTAYRILRDMNFKYEKSRDCTGSFIDFCKFMSFIAAKKTALYISLKNVF